MTVGRYLRVSLAAMWGFVPLTFGAISACCSGVGRAEPMCPAVYS